MLFRSRNSDTDSRTKSAVYELEDDIFAGQGISDLLLPSRKGRPGGRQRRRREILERHEKSISREGTTLEDACDVRGPRKRKYRPPTYMSRADLMEKSHEQLVRDIILRMTPRQLESRCTHNKVHFLLSESERKNPLWNQPSTISLLGKGPNSPLMQRH